MQCCDGRKAANGAAAGVAWDNCDGPVVVWRHESACAPCGAAGGFRCWGGGISLSNFKCIFARTGNNTLSHGSNALRQRRLYRSKSPCRRSGAGGRAVSTPNAGDCRLDQASHVTRIHCSARCAVVHWLLKRASARSPLAFAVLHAWLSRERFSLFLTATQRRLGARTAAPFCLPVHPPPSHSHATRSFRMLCPIDRVFAILESEPSRRASTYSQRSLQANTLCQ